MRTSYLLKAQDVVELDCAAVRSPWKLHIMSPDLVGAPTSQSKAASLKQEDQQLGRGDSPPANHAFANRHNIARSCWEGPAKCLEMLRIVAEIARDVLGLLATRSPNLGQVARKRVHELA